MHYTYEKRGKNPEEMVLRETKGKNTSLGECSLEECKSEATIRTLCRFHYSKARQGKIEVPSHLGVTVKPKCIIPECEKIQICKGFCTKHYQQEYKYTERVDRLPHRTFIESEGIENHGCQVGGCANKVLAKSLCKKHYGMVRTYNLTPAQISAFPPMCENPGCTSTTRLHVDHDHETGKIRGILCGSCNVSLGLLGENLDRIMGLVEYKKLHS